jgi:hypothetical protein
LVGNRWEQVVSSGDARVMSGILSRWPVVVALPVTASDRDVDGRLLDAAVERLAAEARAAYFERCATVDPSAIDVESVGVQPGQPMAGVAEVTVSIGVVEVSPETFTMLARIRPVGPADGDGLVATATCSLAPRGGVSTAMRDEFIAHAQSAAHFH